MYTCYHISIQCKSRGAGDYRRSTASCIVDGLANENRHHQAYPWADSVLRENSQRMGAMNEAAFANNQQNPEVIKVPCVIENGNIMNNVMLNFDATTLKRVFDQAYPLLYPNAMRSQTHDPPVTAEATHVHRDKKSKKRKLHN
eukprot:Pgem_evm1s9006